MFRDRIQEQYESLSPRFRTLADFILENTLDVGFLTATALARRVGVDPATVVRFSQELGYSGFRELSREIKTYINDQLALRYKKEEPEQPGTTGEITRLINELSDRILDVKVEAGQLAEIVESIRAARQILVTASTIDYGMATLWTSYLQLIGLPAQSMPVDPGRAALALRETESEDLVVAISFGLGSGLELGHVLNEAREMGLKTISITASPTLLPAREADLNLSVPSKTPRGYPSFDAVVAVLSVLWQALIKEDETTSDLKLKASMDRMMHLVNQKEKVPSYDSAALQRLWDQESNQEA
jgi:DNA-binding MurR/RpiR family transcriptional regulator